ncbi:MAG: AAA family ATPase, partial [Candidatus Aminicenantes bacterium]|nr:AAA family ATPase [Candidatus Aminicenantes bacterium]
MSFIDRDKELALLEKEYKRTGASFAVIYGRRRVGKTTLIKEFIKNKQAIYCLADKQDKKIQLNRFKDIAAENWDDDVLRQISVDSWDGIFNYILKHNPPGKRLIIVIDEFQYLTKVNKAVPSIFQRIWDDVMKDRDIMLILCGSLISMMYDTTLSYKSPLLRQSDRVTGDGAKALI